MNATRDNLAEVQLGKLAAERAAPDEVKKFAERMVIPTEPVDLMVREHDRDVKAFQRAAQNEKDPQIKDWAAKTLPTLQEHQKLAKETDSHVRTARKERATPSASPDSTQK